jgi:hypothetical protein
MRRHKDRDIRCRNYYASDGALMVVSGATGVLICFCESTGVLRTSAYYDLLMCAAALGFAFAFSVGSLRSPIRSLVVAIGVSLIVPHESCGMSTAGLPLSSIQLSWFFGSLAHLAIRRGRK